MACRGKSTIKNIVSMSKERQCKCTCPAHSLQHPDPRSHIPEMATPGNSLFPGTSCNKLPSPASFNMSCLGASLSCSATGSFRIDSNSCFHPAGLPQSDKSQPDRLNQNLRPCFRLASADAKCHASVKSMQIRKSGATEPGAASTCMRRPRSRPKRSRRAAGQNYRVRRSGCRYFGEPCGHAKIHTLCSSSSDILVGNREKHCTAL